MRNLEQLPADSPKEKTTTEGSTGERGPEALERWIARNLSPAVVHELGHYTMIRLLDREGKLSCRADIDYTVSLSKDDADPVTEKKRV